MTSSRETAARAIVVRLNPARGKAVVPVYVTDGIDVPRRKRRVLLDLAPATVKRLYDAAQRDFGYRMGVGEEAPRDLLKILAQAMEALR